MNDGLIKTLVYTAQTEDVDYFRFVKNIAEVFPKNLKEQLNQLVNGPVWDGDIISKNDRDRLLYIGLAIRICYKGEQGYTGAPYISYLILKELNESCNNTS